MALTRVNVVVDEALLEELAQLKTKVNRSAVFQRALAQEIAWVRKQEELGVVTLPLAEPEAFDDPDDKALAIAFTGRLAFSEEPEPESPYGTSEYYITAGRQVLMYDTDGLQYRVLTPEQVTEARFLGNTTKSKLMLALELDHIRWLDI